jgi:hypothetical protein
VRLRPGAIPSADIGALRGAIARTRLVRVVLALVLVASLVSAYLLSRQLDVRQGGFLPVGSTGVIVVDLSASISQASNRRIFGVVENAVKSDQPTGLVFFSDTAYELAPPRTPGDELRPILRFFKPRRMSRAERLRILGRTGGQPEDVFIRNPWQDDFRGGTRISAGLGLARGMLRREHIDQGSVLLVSDLDYSFGDLSDLTRVLLRYRAERLPLRIVPLFPGTEDRDLFRRMLGRDALVSWKELRGTMGPQATIAPSGTLPVGLIVAGVVAALLLAVNELRCARLYLPRSSRV